MAFVWSESITQGDKILEAVLQEIRDNLDTLEGAGTADIEAGTYAWFYQSSAPTGWTTDGTLGDAVLAVHGSSSYDGSSGGGEQQGSWTQDNHLHTGPSHNHMWYDCDYSSNNDYTYNVAGSHILINVNTNSYMGVRTTTGSTEKPNVDFYTSNSGTANTSSDASANTWRPLAVVGIIASRDA